MTIFCVHIVDLFQKKITAALFLILIKQFCIVIIGELHNQKVLLAELQFLTLLQFIANYTMTFETT